MEVDDTHSINEPPGFEPASIETCLLSLPYEVLELILQVPCLHHCDLAHVALTCQQLKHVCESNDLWKHKVNQR